MMERGGIPGHIRLRKEPRDQASFSPVGRRSSRMIGGATSSARVPEDFLAVPEREILDALANLGRTPPPYVGTWRRIHRPSRSDAQAISPGSAARARPRPESNRARDSPSFLHPCQEQTLPAPRIARSWTRALYLSLCWLRRRSD